MSELNTAFEVWTTIKDQLNYPKDAASDVLDCLIDNLGYSSDDIKASDFVNDPDIKHALVDLDLLEETDEDEGLDEWGDELDEDDEDDDY
jgi:hypothetical protein